MDETSLTMSQNKENANKMESIDPAEELLKQAEKHIDRFEYELALPFSQRAIDVDPTNVKAFETLASVLLEMGEFEKPKTYFERAINLSPDIGHTKYMSLAQLCKGTDSVNYYRKGIEILSKEMETVAVESAVEKHTVLKKELSDAYCALVEIFMTDLCDEADAKEHCADSVEKAISVDPQNAEAYLCKANYLFTTHDITEAKSAMQKSLALWLPQMQAVVEGKADNVDPVEVCSLPYDSRIAAVKLLLDMGDHEMASEILELLLSENDADGETWYLSGLTNYFRGEGFKSNARYYLKKAQKVAKNTGIEVSSLMQHIDEMLAELGPGSGDEDDDDDDDDKENGNVNNDSEGSNFLSSVDEENTMET